MSGNRIRSLGGLAAAAALAFAVSAAQVSAQAVSIAGTWNMEVTTDQGTTNPTMTLQQQGEAVTGHYSSATLGEADGSGTLTGNRFRFSFNVDMQGQAVPVVYEATIDANGVMTGTIDVAGGLASGTFTARKAS